MKLNEEDEVLVRSKKTQHSPSYFILRKDNILKRHALSNGQLLQTFYLTPSLNSTPNYINQRDITVHPFKVSFKQINWNCSEYDIVIKGRSIYTLVNKSNHQIAQTRIENFDDIFYLFTVKPFQFHFSFKIEEKAFLNKKRSWLL